MGLCLGVFYILAEYEYVVDQLIHFGLLIEMHII